MAEVLQSILPKAAAAPAPTLSSIAVTPAAPGHIAVGSTLQFAASGTYSDGSVVDITTQVIWASSDVGIATISSTGLAIGAEYGNTNITASMSGKTSPVVILTVQELFGCPYCGLFFGSMGEMVAHISEAHPDMPPWTVVDIGWGA